MLLGSAQAEEFYGFGPIPVRNYQPIQLIFLNLPIARARTLAAGVVEAHLETVESNTIVKVAEPQLQAEVKVETNRTVIGAAFGLRPGSEIGVDIPFISHFGGFLDPFVDSVEDLFGTTNPERDDYPNNAFGAFSVRRGASALFEGKRQVFEIGDLWLSGKQELVRAEGLPLLAVRAAVKAPTGRAGGVFGSGHPDFGLGLAAEYQVLSGLMLYANLTGVFPTGRVTPAHLTLNPFLNQGVAAEVRVWRNLSLLLQQQMFTSPLHGTGTRMLDGTVVEVTVGATLALGAARLQCAAVDNISPVATAADFSLLLRLAYEI